MYYTWTKKETARDTIVGMTTIITTRTGGNGQSRGRSTASGDGRQQDATIDDYDGPHDDVMSIDNR